MTKKVRNGCGVKNMPKPLSISLVQTRLLALDFQIKQELDPEAPPEKVKLDISMSGSSSYNSKNKILNVLMSISIDQDNIPFSLEASYGGLFKVTRKPNKEEMKRLEMINCPAILLPFFRECIAEVTRRGGVEPVILPIMNFVEFSKKVEIIEERKGRKKPKKN